ncbi:MAG: heme-binding protein [Halarchaeum sp.]
MKAKAKLKAVGVAAGVGALALGAWSVAGTLANRGVERVPYTVVGELGDVELRRYPETVRVRTTAPTQYAAFRRLFRYIDGENAGANGERSEAADGEAVSMTAPVETGESVAMTAPVQTGDERDGEAVSMTAPVETDEEGEGVTMSFFLPDSYTPETAPEPTSDDVELVVDPPRTMAAYRFSWWTPNWRVRRAERRVARTLDDAGIDSVGEFVLRRYDAPVTPPFRRTNEVLVEVDSGSVRRALAGERST